MSTDTQLLRAADTLSDALRGLTFSGPVSHVYNPLEYAREAHSTFIKKFATSRKRVVLLGMNPGPFGMAQTGVPFGEISAVRDWMGIETPVAKPPNEHPKRPVTGFACTRSEVSGRRLWELFAERFKTAGAFFADHFVVNYCPLVFMEESGRNRTPDKLPAEERAPVYEACNSHLRTVFEALDPEHAVGVGGFAEKRLHEVFPDAPFQISTILHPSPASPAANRGWGPAATAQFEAAGIWLR